MSTYVCFDKQLSDKLVIHFSILNITFLHYISINNVIYTYFRRANLIYTNHEVERKTTKFEY